jgi:multiple sugar transport system substrate-binding protein
MRHSSFLTSRSIRLRSWSLLFVCLLAMFVAACGSSSSTTAGKVTLTFGWWSNGAVSDNLMKSWIKDFESTHPNITIKPEILPWDNYWSKLQTTTAAGNAYDIAGMCSCQAAAYYNKGVFTDLSQFSDYASTVQQLIPAPQELHAWDGKHYGVPIGTEISNIGYNQDLFKAAGVPYPSATTSMSFADFEAMATKLLKKDSSGKVTQYPFHNGGIGGWFYWETFVYMEGGHPYDRAVNPTKVTMNNPAGIAGLSDIESLYQKQLVPPVADATNGAWGDGEDDSLTTNKVAMARVGIWSMPNYQQQHAPWGLFPMFSIKQPVILGSANALTIYKGSKNQQAAWEFIKWAASDHAESTFAKFSDVPTNKTTLSNLASYVTPGIFVPTMLKDLSYYQPATESANAQLATTMNQILTDMANGKITPAQAAAQMDQQGNQVLTSGS